MSEKSIVSVNGTLATILQGESLDDYSDISISDKAKDRIFRTLLNTKVGLAAIAPALCKGLTDCPFRSRCPIYLADGQTATYPVGKQCLFEASFVREKFVEYLAEFEFNEQEVENSPTLRSLISELVSLDLYDLRISLVLAGVADPKDTTLMITQTIALTEEKDEITQLQEHPAWHIKEKIHKQRMEILDVLVATPRRKAWKKATLKEGNRDDYLSQMRKMQEKLESLTEAVLKEKE